MFVAAPIAPKTPETLLALKELHPFTEPTELSLPTIDAPVFNDQLVRQALFSFPITSAAGLFGTALLSFSSVQELNRFTFFTH